MQIAEEFVEAPGPEEAFGPLQQGLGVGAGQALTRDRRGRTKLGGHQTQQGVRDTFLMAFAEDLLIEAGFLQLHLGWLQHGADLIAGQGGKFIVQNGFDQIQDLQGVGAGRGGGHQVAGLGGGQGDLQYDEARQPGIKTQVLPAQRSHK